MDICRVVGNVISTNKCDKLSGMKLLVVRGLDPETMEATSKTVVAVDAVGAGEGEVVLLVSGSSARMTPSSEGKPVDAVIVGIVDAIELEGRRVFSKYPGEGG